MNTPFETPSRFSPAGLTTAAVLLVMVAMGASTLFPDATAPGASTAASQSHVAQSHGAHAKKGWTAKPGQSAFLAVITM